MGRAKAAMMEREDNLAAAAEFLVSIGTLQRCEGHSDLYDGDGDLEQAFKTTAFRHKRGELNFGAGMSQREVTDLVQQAYDDNSAVGACPSCDRNKRKD